MPWGIRGNLCVCVCERERERERGVFPRLAMALRRVGEMKVQANPLLRRVGGSCVGDSPVATCTNKAPRSGNFSFVLFVFKSSVIPSLLSFVTVSYSACLSPSDLAWKSTCLVVCGEM